MSRRRILRVLLLACLALAHALPALAQGAASINYVYDDLGRLVAVIDQQGNVATYNYDLVGNLLSIVRVDAPVGQNIAITYFTPARGRVTPRRGSLFPSVVFHSVGNTASGLFQLLQSLDNVKALVLPATVLALILFLTCVAVERKVRRSSGAAPTLSSAC